MKLFYFLFLISILSLLSNCNKYYEPTYSEVNTIILNDTIGASSSYEESYGFNDFEIINSSNSNEKDYYFKTINTASSQELIFYGRQKVVYNVYEGDDYLKSMKKGDLIDDYTRTSMDALNVLDRDNPTLFKLNSIAYIGFPTGWIKIKTLDNYHSCVILSYGVRVSNDKDGIVIND